MDVEEVEVNAAGDGVCRICDRNASEMHSVFEKNDEGQQLIQLIKECLPVIIYRTDPLSKEVCSECLENLVNFYKFRKDSVDVAARQALRLKNGERNDAVDLYLGQVENGCDETMVNNAKERIIDRATSPFENGQRATPLLCANCRSVEPEGNEIEMCAELHKAIADSLIQNNQHLEDSGENNECRSVQLRNKRKRNEGFYTEFDESQDSSVATDFTYTESTRNTESQSDMELCDSDHEYRTNEDFTKRRRIMGPKSIQENYRKERMLQILKTEPTVVYNPFTLSRLALNAINYKNVPDFWSPTCEKTIIETERSCTYCYKKFLNVKLLAMHEAEHMSIEMGVRIDDTNLWDESRDDAEIRNKWLESVQEDELVDVEAISEQESEQNGECVDGDLLVPVSTSSSSTNVTKSGGEVVLVDGKAMVNGVLLTEIPKDERRAMYKTITINGVKRKFCPLCRYTFKDNWAIESHYFSNSCLYTCRYCGIRFNKQRYQFEAHIKDHKKKGDEISTNMFAPRKWNTTYPRIINETRLKPRPPPKLRQPLPKVKTVDMKHLIERKSLQPNLRVKTESQNDSTPTSAAAATTTNNSTPPTSNQAYFCRKCYQVFFMLDEFNKHVTQCNGQTSQPNNVQKNNHRASNVMVKGGGKGGGNSALVSNSTTTTSDNNEIYSATGRPMRHCVKEVGTYKDAPEIEPVERTYEKNSGLRSSRGFECGICDAAFSNVHSRNSHMRIHKNEEVTTYQQQQSNYENDYDDDDNDYSVKQEPLEPIVEIDENPHSFPSSIGSVSITPIPKANINPNIMKLVQNNPHLTIKSMNSGGGGDNSPSSSSIIDVERSYKCANCSRQFSNKSNLYFHKKNQCGGSKYPCPFCKKRFGTEAAYSSHIFYSHPE